MTNIENMFNPKEIIKTSQKAQQQYMYQRKTDKVKSSDILSYKLKDTVEMFSPIKKR